MADIPEGELAAVIFNHSHLRSMVLSAGGAMQDSHWVLATQTVALGAYFTSIGPGDIDAIVFPHGNIGSATAYELKRIKIQRHTFGTGTPGKLSEIKKAVDQANRLERMGFSRVVLLLLMVTDGRERKEFNFAFRGATNALLRTVDKAVDLSELHSAVGAFRLEITQPIDRDFTDSGGVTVKGYRIGNVRTQSAELTLALKGALAKNSGA